MGHSLPERYSFLPPAIPTFTPVSYVFKDSKTSSNVSRALLSVAEFSKKEALVRFNESSISIIWSGSSRAYFIHAETSAEGLFRNRQQLQIYGPDYCNIIKVSPLTLGKTLKGSTHDRNVSLCIAKPNIVKVSVEYKDAAIRGIVHTVPCEIKTVEDYKSMHIGEIEKNVCRYDTQTIVSDVRGLKHIINSFVRLSVPTVYIWSRQTMSQGNKLMICARTLGSSIKVSLSDLESGFDDRRQEDVPNSRREEANVCIETRKLAFFLSGLFVQRNSKLSLDIEHNKCLKITLDTKSGQGEKFYHSVLLLHTLSG